MDTMFLACKHASPAMIRTVAGGAIVNTSSISALRARGLTAYTVSKGAANSQSRPITVLTASARTVSPPDPCIRPWSMPAAWATGTEQAHDARRQTSVLKREGTGWDIGGTVRFLLSDQACYIIGQVLVVDCGATLVGPSSASQ